MSLTEDPFPGKGGEKELLKLLSGISIYRYTWPKLFHFLINSG